MKTARNAKTFSCKECGLGYADKETARKCQDWCSKHKSCNIEITRHAIG